MRLRLRQHASIIIWHVLARLRLTTRFTYKYYHELLHELNRPRYVVLRVIDFIRLARRDELPNDKVVVVLRHDVDRRVDSAMRMAELELMHGIRSTYYIRTRGPYDPFSEPVASWLKSLALWGFEVGYHYETLFAAGYDVCRALKLFEKDLKRLRELVPVYTVCAHGNVGARMPDFKMFELAGMDLRGFGLEAEAQLTVRELAAGRPYEYRSDTGSRWHDWLGALRQAEAGSVIYFNIHPDWWHPP